MLNDHHLYSQYPWRGAIQETKQSMERVLAWLVACDQSSKVLKLVPESTRCDGMTTVCGRGTVCYHCTTGIAANLGDVWMSGEGYKHDV